VIRVGNLKARRDFTDIRDVVKAYVIALERCEAGSVYNIGSGVGFSIKQVLDLLLAMSKLIIQVKEDPAQMRPSDVPVMVSDSSRFMGETGWRPQIPFKQSLLDLLQYWREKLGRGHTVCVNAQTAVPDNGLSGLEQFSAFRAGR
jgi:GDP-4-dehydro-6-deoxy-D-mannose reductase